MGIFTTDDLGYNLRNMLEELAAKYLITMRRNKYSRQGQTPPYSCTSLRMKKRGFPMLSCVGRYEISCSDYAHKVTVLGDGKPPYVL